MNRNSVPMNGKVATLIADGVEVPFNSDIFNNAQLVVTNAFDHIPSWYTPRGICPYRAALIVGKDGIIDDMSVTEAVQGGTVGAKEAKGIKIHSTSDNFAALICDAGEYAIRDSVLIFDSNSDGRNHGDFCGYGAIIDAFNGSKIELENVDLYTRGVSRSAAFVDSYSHVLIKDSKIRSMGGQLYPGYINNADQSNMVAPPWVLGITGNCRTTNMMGDCGTTTVVGSDVWANQWGVLSTDSGSDMVLMVIDSTIGLLGEGQVGDPYSRNYGSGYGSYIIDDAVEYFRGVKMYVGTYIAVVCGGTATYESSNGVFATHPMKFVYDGSPDVTNHFGKVTPGHYVAEDENAVFSGIVGKGEKTVMHSDAFGFMSHDFGTINILDGTEIYTKNAIFLHKDGDMTVNVDNAKLVSDDKVIFQLIDNDDDAVGARFKAAAKPGDPTFAYTTEYAAKHSDPTFIFNTEYFEKSGYPGIDYPAPGSKGDVKIEANLTNSDLCGDFYNATGYVLGGMSGEEAQGRILTLNLGKGAKLDGAVCATSSIHVDEYGRQNTHFTIDEYYYLGHIANKPYYNGANDIAVNLTDDAVWTVTGTSVITALSISDGASVKGKAIIDGKPTVLESGKTYTGVITIEAE